jgi:TonB-linked SusC/RagA family outer membrane protein
MVLIIVFSMGFLQAQTRTNLTGKVVSEVDNMPIPGANIVIKGTSTGAVSDFDGMYSIEASSEDTIVFSYVGYVTQEIVVGSKTTINVSLKEDLNSLEEVVVIGYGTVKKSDLTGSVASIKSNDLVKPKSTSFLEAMQGRMAGVQVKQSSGEPGAAVNIKIRGVNSVNASSNPLYVIDGVQIDVNEGEVASSSVGNSSSMNPLATLNPNDIKSIEVLKDASATAIYGSRGANGVVIVTTKDGKNRKATFTYQKFLSFSKATKKIDVLNGLDYIDYRRAINRNNDDPLLYVDTDNDGILDSERDLSTIPLHDWQDEALRNSFTQSHNISASGGNEKTDFSASLGYLNQDAIIRNNNYLRINSRIKLNHKFSDKFSTGFNLISAYSEQSGATSSGGNTNFNGVLQSLIISKPTEFFNEDDAGDAVFGRYVSPISMIDIAEKNISLTQVISNIWLKYNFTKTLDFKVRIGGNTSSSKGKEFYSKNTTWGVQDNGRGVLQNRKSISYFAITQLNYRLSLNKIHNFNFMVAAERNYYNQEGFKTDVTDFSIESTGINDISVAGGFRELSSFRFSTNRISILGRLNYSFKDKYLLTASIRRDGSDKFGPGNRFGIFPSGAFAWKISEEKFLKNSETVSNLKLRLGYGVTGNERIPPYSYFASLGNTWYSSNGQLDLGLAPASRANPDLKWETTAQYNAGIDIGLFNNRLNLSVDAYEKNTSDMLLLTPLSSQTGYFSQFTNIGNIENKGVEIGITSYNIQNSKFTWSSSLNGAYNKNEVTSLGTSESIPVVINGGYIRDVGIVQEGSPLGSIYGYEWDGVYQIDDFNWQNNNDPNIDFYNRVFTLKDGVVANQSASVRPGALKFKDLNGDGVVDAENDRTVIGNSYPDFFGGVSNSFKFGNFDFDFFLEWQYGNEIFNEARFRQEGFNLNNITQDYYDNRWTPNNPSNTHGIRSGGNPTSRIASSYYVEDGSYIRLANMTFGYNLPKPIVESVSFKSLRLYVTGTNLKTWTEYSGYDPDISFNNPLLTGFDRTSYPRSMSLIFGLNVTF